MAQIPQLLARLKRDPIADFPIERCVNQHLRDHPVPWRRRLLTPLVTLRLFLTQIAWGNCAIAALRQMCGLDFARDLLETRVERANRRQSSSVRCGAIRGKLFFPRGSSVGRGTRPLAAAGPPLWSQHPGFRP